MGYNEDTGDFFYFSLCKFVLYQKSTNCNKMLFATGFFERIKKLLDAGMRHPFVKKYVNEPFNLKR